MTLFSPSTSIAAWGVIDFSRHVKWSPTNTNINEGDEGSRGHRFHERFIATIHCMLTCCHSDNSILQELDIQRELPGHVRKRKRSYFGRLCRDHGCHITKTVAEGYVEGRRRRGRPRKQYIDNIKQWAQSTTSQCVWAAEDRSRWKQLVSQAMVANDHT